jgi:uncharacterized protein YbjT (DUF2867 family)
MILVLGATGSTGGEVARQLIAAGVKPRLFVRNKAKASEFEGKTEIVGGDLNDTAAFESALRGVEKLYLVATGLEGFDLEIKAIDAARKSGVHHIVKLSAIGADQPVLTFSQWHATVEKQLMDSGVAWTMLRPGFFMTNALMLWSETIRSESAFYQPTGEGRWAVIDARDIAAVAIKAMTEPGHEGKGYTLTGSESFSGAEYAEKFSRILGRTVKFVDVPPEAAKDGMLKSGVPEKYADAVLNLMAAMKAGQADLVTNTFEELSGRRPGSFEDWIRRNIAAFQ